jgi:hypothetical protein
MLSTLIYSIRHYHYKIVFELSKFNIIIIYDKLIWSKESQQWRIENKHLECVLSEIKVKETFDNDL